MSDVITKQKGAAKTDRKLVKERVMSLLGGAPLGGS